MSHLNDPDNFAGRVNYAATCFLRGATTSRGLSNCFENHDGDAVVVALVRRAQKNPKLHSAIARQWREGFPSTWLETASKYESETNLTDLARRLRAKAKAELDAWYVEQAAKRQKEGSV